ncbi:unnamed protein product [Peniophora sp. CBMAI 1063]|nr:unnamed protein product [Peniophora sp. CBMAI 1063]
MATPISDPMTYAPATLELMDSTDSISLQQVAHDDDFSPTSTTSPTAARPLKRSPCSQEDCTDPQRCLEALIQNLRDVEAFLQRSLRAHGIISADDTSPALLTGPRLLLAAYERQTVENERQAEEIARLRTDLANEQVAHRRTIAEKEAAHETLNRAKVKGLAV